jgi:tRNA-dihydrouridine synthase
LFLYLAPLRGITDHIFRTVYSTHFTGFNCAIAPFVTSVKGKIVKASHVKDLLPENNRKLPLIPQVIGKNPDEFIVMADQLKTMGYTSFNWNLGCPFPQVTRKKRGSGLLPYPEIIEAFLSDIFPRLPIGLSIKLRLGLTDKNDIKKLIPIFNKFPLGEIIVHARTGAQMYEGSVDLDGFEECLKSCIHPMVYNGDITGVEIFKALSGRFSTVSSWMIGRQAVVDPFFVETLLDHKPSPLNKRVRIKDYHDALLKAYLNAFDFEDHALDKMKGIWLYMARSFTNGQKILKRIQKSRSTDAYREVTEKAFLEETLVLYP